MTDTLKDYRLKKCIPNSDELQFYHYFIFIFFTQVFSFLMQFKLFVISRKTHIDQHSVY